MSTEILAILNQFITEKILKQRDRSIHPDAPIISSGLVDSFSLMDLSLFIEDTFSVRIADVELSADTFDTLNQLAALISSRQ
jgi:acyl carrier protein